MSEFKIEKGIELVINLGRNEKYPFRKMAIGDSFFVASPMEHAARSCAYAFAHRNAGFKFATGIVDGGVRIWRVKT